MTSDQTFKDRQILLRSILPKNINKSGHIFPFKYIKDEGFYFFANYENDHMIHLIGGQSDSEDKDSISTAIRETKEETLLR